MALNIFDMIDLQTNEGYKLSKTTYNEYVFWHFKPVADADQGSYMYVTHGEHDYNMVWFCGTKQHYQDIVSVVFAGEKAPRLLELLKSYERYMADVQTLDSLNVQILDIIVAK